MSPLRYKTTGLFLFFVSLATTLRLYFSSLHTIYANTDGIHDELLFLRHSSEILAGHWLGEYNYLTLAKLPVYPVWLALVRYLGVNCIIAQHVLYVISCAVLILAVCPLVKSYKVLLALYILLLFNPAYLSSQILDRVLRCGIYTSLIVLVFSSYIGIIFYKDRYFVSLVWSLLGGISLSFLWLAREESLWIVPFVIIGSIAVVAMTYPEHGLKSLIFVILPAFLLSSSISLLRYINYKYYKRPITVELKDKNFIRFYNALMRVKCDGRGVVRPVPGEAREKIYKISPTFRKVRRHLEGDVLDRWYGLFEDVCHKYKSDGLYRRKFDEYFGYTINPFYQDFTRPDGLICNKKDYYGGWFIWGLLDALDSSGLFADGRVTEKFYNDVYRDITLACRSGKLRCSKTRRGLIPDIRLSDLRPLLHNMYLCVRKTVTCRGILTRPLESTGSAKNKELFASALHARVYRTPSTDTEINGVLLWIFKMVTPVLFILSMGALCFGAISRKCNWELFVAAVLCFVIFVARNVVVVVFDYYFAPGLDVRYLSPCYFALVVLIFFSLLSLKVKGDG